MMEFRKTFIYSIRSIYIDYSSDLWFYILQDVPNANTNKAMLLSMHLSFVYVFNRGKQKDYRWDRKQGTDVYCWFVHNSGKGFIDAHYTSYIVPSLNSFLPSVWVCISVWAQKEWTGSVGISYFKQEKEKVCIRKCILKLPYTRELYRRNTKHGSSDRWCFYIHPSIYTYNFHEKHNLTLSSVH